jgi:hypothetical protein
VVFLSADNTQQRMSFFHCLELDTGSIRISISLSLLPYAFCTLLEQLLPNQVTFDGFVQKQQIVQKKAFKF